MPNQLEHLPLRIRMLDLLHPHDLVLVEHLDSVGAVVVVGSDKVHSTKGARPERSDEGEVAEVVPRRRLLRESRRL